MKAEYLMKPHFFRLRARAIARALLAFCFLVAGSTAGLAAVFTVNSPLNAHDADTTDGICDDGAGHCTLRAALEQADQLGGTNTINVPTGTYLLDAALGPLVTGNSSNNLSLVGVGAPGSVIIDGQNATTIFELNGNGSTVSINNLVIQQGYRLISNPGAYGVCIGAGIAVYSGMTVNVSYSAVQNNTAAYGSGGGICINFGTFNLDNSTVQGNVATFGGGGIRITSGLPPGTLNITNSTISGNTTTGDPANPGNAQSGGIVSQATVNITNSTLSGNSGQNAGSAFVGANSSVLTLRNVTVVGNIGTGGQISAQGPGISMIAESTIIANPVGGGPNCVGTTSIQSSGHNLESGNTCNFTAASDLLNANPQLGPLQNNGGITVTHALLSGSPAIDHGSNPANLTTDQRGAGFGRVVGVAADTGAFEFAGPGGAPTLDVDASVAATKYDVLTDGLLIVRYLFGLTGTSLTSGALGGTATRTDPVAIKAYLDSVRSALDVDGDGNTDALTDGLLIVRYLLGLHGNALVGGAVGASATRTSAAAIGTYIQSLMP